MDHDRKKKRLIVEDLSDIEKYQLAVAVLAAKFESKKSDLLLGIDLLNDILVSIREAEFADRALADRIDEYFGREFPYGGAQDATSVVVEAIKSYKDLTREMKITKVRQYCFPFKVSDVTASRILSAAEDSKTDD